MRQYKDKIKICLPERAGESFLCFLQTWLKFAGSPCGLVPKTLRFRSETQPPSLADSAWLGSGYERARLTCKSGNWKRGKYLLSTVFVGKAVDSIVRIQ